MRYKTHTVVRVFLASPGDLEPERQCVRDAFNEINAFAERSLGVKYQLYGWEEQPPGFGRPQEQINPHVHACDIFLGLLWRRWGSDSGKASSGFEEEYGIALVRAKSQGHPQIWLAFKHVDEQSMRDPGLQLQKVLDFRREQIKQRDLLFSTFSAAADLQAAVRQWALAYLFTAKAPLTLPHEDVAPARAHQSTDQLPYFSPGVPGESHWPSSAQITAKQILRGDPVHTADDVDIARTILALYPAFSIAGGGVDVCIHVLYTLYAERDRVGDLTIPERITVLCQLLTDEMGETSMALGWWWFKGLEHQELIAILSRIMEIDNIGEVSKVAIMAILDWTNVEVPSEILCDSWIPAISASGSSSLKRSLLLLLAEVGVSEVLPLLQSLAEDGNEGDVAFARFRISARDSDERSAAVAWGEVTRHGETQLANLIGTEERNAYPAPIAQLLSSTMMPDFGQQTFWQMTQEQMMQMMQMMMQMMRQSMPLSLPLPHQVAPGLWPTVSPSFEPAELQSPTSVTDAVCADFATVAARIRDYLTVGGLTPFPLEQYRSVFSQAALINASLEALVQCGSKSDIIFAYRYLHASAVPADVIISLFKQFGSDEDVSGIVRRASGLADERMRKIVVAVLLGLDRSSMRKEIERVLEVFPDNVVALMNSLLRSSEVERDSLETVVSLLSHRRAKVRRGAVAVLARQRRGDRLFFEQLLVSNMESSFDVLCWLDRLAYAPGFISEYFYGVLLELNPET